MQPTVRSSRGRNMSLFSQMFRAVVTSSPRARMAAAVSGVA
jgi:hypothetical protein